MDTTAFFGTDPAQSVSQDGQNDTFLIQPGHSRFAGHQHRRQQDGLQRPGGHDLEHRAPPGRRPRRASSSTWPAGSTSSRPTRSTAIPSSLRRPPASTAGTIVGLDPGPDDRPTGAFGFIRIGGNATNFSAVTNDRLANFYVGGEAKNVNVLTPNGSRNFYFGKGLDTTTILTHSIENIFANRGAINSRVVSERMIGDIMLGGDVVDSTFLSGYVQGLAGVVSTIEQNLSSPHSPRRSRSRPPPRRPTG